MVACPRPRSELGLAFYDGRGVVLQDYERGIALIRQAAEGGNAQAGQMTLGSMYRSGTGIQPDRVKAYMWLNLAAKNGDKSAPSMRDAALALLSPSEVQEAQAQARLLDAGRAGYTSGR